MYNDGDLDILAGKIRSKRVLRGSFQEAETITKYKT